MTDKPRNRLAAAFAAGAAVALGLGIVLVGRARRRAGARAMADETRNEEIATERTDVTVSLAAALFAGFAVVLALSIVGVALVYPNSRRGPSDAPRLLTAQPRLEIDPATDLAAFRAQQQGELAHYGWVDREHGVVRIPIEQAMRDIAKAGINDWPEGAK
ncbi:MAG TPA: hypothetical protein VGG57_07450 [Stellaceae bacterium]|jgi:hypothetical protein